MCPERLSRAALIKSWARQQGFGAADELSAAAVVAGRSWVRTLGGADPYFALFARGVEVEREALDAALLAGELRVSPAVRGCMYLVADEHADLALSAAYHHGHKRNVRDLDKVGCTARQLDKTAKAVRAALAEEGKTTAELRAEAKVAEAIVSFGAAGKKVGLSSSLPPALRQLEFEGAIERTPVGGRLDTESYRWALRARKLTRHDEAEAARGVAELFFRHHAPASFEHFVAWSGLGKRAARAALAELDLVEVEVEGDAGSEAVAMWSTAAALDRGLSRGKASGVALLGLQDLYLVVHGGPGAVCRAAHLGLEIPRWGTLAGGPIGETKHPHLRTVVVDGELAGFWEVDAALAREQLRWLEVPGKTKLREARRRLAGLRAFMAGSLGHAKTFSIDSDKRIDARFELVAGLGVEA